MPPKARMLDEVVISQIGAIGFQPFVLIRIHRTQSAESLWVVCQTQNEAGAFVAELASLPELGSSKLLRAIERALRTEVYESADLLFAWSRDSDGAGGESVLVGLRGGVSFSPYVGYPVFAVEPAGAPASQEEKVRMLIDALEAYHNTSGNDTLRFYLIESLAFGLSRILGQQGRYDVAATVVDRALQYRPYSIYLKAAKHALALKLEGKAVPQRLEKFIGEDTGYLRQFVCPEPFKRFDIGPSGDVLVCCGHWLPTSIGNFQRDPIEGVLNSDMAQKIRRSMTDGSYQYCNHLECGAMIQQTIPTRDELQDPGILRAISEDQFKVEGVEQVLFAFDQTCNLSCPSCRRERIIEKASVSEEKAQSVEQKLLPLLPRLRVLNINPAGELFASKPSRKILELINDERCPDLVLDIISNGTLFSEEEWNKFPGIHNKIRSIRISVDGARKETFEKLRRLAKHDEFLKNMQFLAGLRAQKVIPQLKFSFTYQLDNFREMAEFVRFAISLNCDFVIFERLQNLGAFTDAEFRERAVHRPEHPRHREFLEIVRDPLFRQNSVWHDFDYEGVETLSREEARQRAKCDA